MTEALYKIKTEKYCGVHLQGVSSPAEYSTQCTSIPGVQCPIFEVAQAIKNARVTAQSIRELTKHAAETHVMTRRQLTPNEPDVPDEIHVVCIKNESYLHDEMHPGERYKIDGELNAKPIANENGGIIFERALA